MLLFFVKVDYILFVHEIDRRGADVTAGGGSAADGVRNRGGTSTEFLEYRSVSGMLAGDPLASDLLTGTALGGRCRLRFSE